MTHKVEGPFGEPSDRSCSSGRYERYSTDVYGSFGEPSDRSPGLPAPSTEGEPLKAYLKGLPIEARPPMVLHSTKRGKGLSNRPSDRSAGCQHNPTKQDISEIFR